MAESAPAPKNILRGHKAQVHAAAFIRDNERLVTADAEGYVVVWDLVIMRPSAVWRAHENSILGVRGWGRDKVITHGRDHKLIVWQLAEQDEQSLDTVLPVEHVAQPRRQPWILYLLEVNTLNFCSFAACPRRDGETICGPDASTDILVAVPNMLASEAIDVFALPGQSRLYTVKSSVKNGLVMSLRLLHRAGCLTLLAGFEDGCASVQRLCASGAWVTTYRSQAHSQPILSLDLHPSQECFFTSSADSIIAQHPIPTAQQSLTSSASISGQSIRETGSSEANSAEPFVSDADAPNITADPDASRPTERLQEWKHPLKIINTKHSGQQSLKVRSDGKVFATAGWDSKIRVYSSKTLKELAVLQWHKVGAYAVAFADVAQNLSAGPSMDKVAGPSVGSNGLVGTASVSVRERRIRQARTTHWIVAGAKDGKVSLWDLY
ncbi:ASTRA-associated protein 1 [Hirsutella rhossiliensis]|uniref:ASTRA-associated protein 1 n=1 Tax=Hirsutella rhossiliensis TaxID=111463 RepID=A0A9P8MRL1_9HYPO|nr:ASTRA-associated protein 1 [Hirsutella rhossiliensis]KAH0959940.1 ASTRA-associated protein 1 [Hirsutella rhossiliensis]